MLSLFGGFADAILTFLLLLAAGVGLAELTRRHHRTVARHAVRHGKRGASAACRGTRGRRRGPRLRRRQGKAAPLGGPASPAPKFRRLRGEPEDPAAETAPGNGVIAPGPHPLSPAPQITLNGGITRMTISRIAPERRARRTAARTSGRTGGASPPSGGRSSPWPPTSSPKTTALCSTG